MRFAARDGSLSSVFIATNRNLDPSRSGAGILLDSFDDETVLRWVEAVGARDGIDVRVIDEDETARALGERACARERAVVLHVHGFGTGVEALVEHGRFFDERYGVETLAFCWPGEARDVRGLLRYADARYRTGAASRALARLLDVLAARRSAVANDTAGGGTTVNALFHSMGCHLLERLVTELDVTDLALDNIVLAAPDVAVAGHSAWIGRLRVRGAIWIVANAWDYALAGSRMQVGTSREPRLGQHLTDERAANAEYVDLGGVPAVGPSHGYYANLAVVLDDRVAALFERLLNGGDPRTLLRRGVDGVFRLD